MKNVPGMRALSLTQPWATLVAIGAKRVETRSWPTSFRGELAIHAAKGYPKWAQETAQRALFRDAIGANPLPRGAIIAVVTLKSCVPVKSVFEWISREELAFGDYADGRSAWLFAPIVRRLAEPIYCRGMLGLWSVPEETEARILKQLAFDPYDAHPSHRPMPHPGAPR